MMEKQDFQTDFLLELHSSCSFLLAQKRTKPACRQERSPDKQLRPVYRKQPCGTVVHSDELHLFSVAEPGLQII